MGHSTPTAAQAIEPVHYRNPDFQALGIEALTLADLRSRVPERHRLFNTRPQFHFLVLVSAGRLSQVVDFERHDCRAGDVLHVRPGQVQQLTLQRGAQGQVLLFAPDFAPQGGDWASSMGLALTLLEAAVPGTVLQLPARPRAAIAAAFDAIAAEYQATDGGALSAGVLRHQLAALLLMLARQSSLCRTGTAPPEGASARVFARFVRELETGFADARSVAAYAQRLGYSTKTLVRACQAVAGIPAKELIERRIVLEAKRLLAQSSLPVGVIASETGFSEATNFVKFFRRREGMAPTQFRALHGGSA